MRVYCEASGMEIVDELFDYGEPGTTYDREKLRLAYAMLARDEADGICFEKPNRAGREGDVFIKIWEKVVVDLGKEFWVVNVGQVRRRGHAMRLAGEVDEEYADLKHSLRAGKNRLVEEEGLNPGSVPYGFVVIGANRSLMAEDPKPAEIIRAMFREKGKGLSDQEVADELNAAGLPAGHDGQSWTARLVYIRCRNGKYKGTIAWNMKYEGADPDYEKRYIERKGAHAAIVSPHLWNAAHRVIEAEEARLAAKREENPGYHRYTPADPTRYLGSGKTKCPVCHEEMSIVGGAVPVIYCYTCPEAPSCSYFPIEMLILNALYNELQVRPEFSDAFARRAIARWREEADIYEEAEIRLNDKLERITKLRINLGMRDIQRRHSSKVIVELSKRLTKNEEATLNQLEKLVDRRQNGPNIEINKIRRLTAALKLARHSGPLIETDANTRSAKNCLRDVLTGLDIKKIASGGTQVNVKFTLPSPTEESIIRAEATYILYDLKSIETFESDLNEARLGFLSGAFTMGPATWNRFKGALGGVYDDLSDILAEASIKAGFEWAIAAQANRIPVKRYDKLGMDPRMASFLKSRKHQTRARCQFIAAIEIVGPTRLGLLQPEEFRVKWAPYAQLHYVCQNLASPRDLIRMPVAAAVERRMQDVRRRTAQTHQKRRTIQAILDTRLSAS